METRTVVDQIGRTVLIPKIPQRIVSLVPSQTELLCGLRLEERVVGITKFCVHPKDWFRNKTRIGGTKQLNFEAISALNPDLIITNKEENNKEDIERLAEDFPIWVSDINNLDSALEMIQMVGEITGTDASVLAEEIRVGFDKLQPIWPTQKTLYLIWKNPFMAAGSDTFIHDLMTRCGFENVTNQGRYPELSEEEIIELNPELVLLSSEPFPFKAKHIQELQELLPKARIKLVDGEMFSWYGSRLKLVPTYLQKHLFIQ
ncbi:MAG: ABC-type Fe3+-hydroxamate transport system substrate-binding protein [Bacteroidia bacterium]|jgi:ABC-type Fe3+-hydroxamate transport system substrate-binding protein